MNNINLNCGKLTELCKYTKHESPMDIIHYIKP